MIIHTCKKCGDEVYVEKATPRLMLKAFHEHLIIAQAHDCKVCQFEMLRKIHKFKGLK